MDEDLDAAAGLASLASSGMTTAPSGKGKPRSPCKTATAPKPKKTLTPEQHARESTKRKGRMHAADARDVAIAAAPSLLPRSRRSPMPASRQQRGRRSIG
ncbi:hypothetical protein D1007_04225 [Hordeum vulgare]|nr:hypothetical protein D1007_04225 [Hordeum vulgare]